MNWIHRPTLSDFDQTRAVDLVCNNLTRFKSRSFNSYAGSPPKETQANGRREYDGLAYPSTCLPHVLAVASPLESLARAFEVSATAECDQVDL